MVAAEAAGLEEAAEAAGVAVGRHPAGAVEVVGVGVEIAKPEARMALVQDIHTRPHPNGSDIKLPFKEIQFKPSHSLEVIFLELSLFYFSYLRSISVQCRFFALSNFYFSSLYEEKKMALRKRKKKHFLLRKLRIL